jgi:hypothetical protein
MAVYCQMVPERVFACPRRVSLNEPTWKQSICTRSPGTEASRLPRGGWGGRSRSANGRSAMRS